LPLADITPEEIRECFPQLTEVEEVGSGGQRRVFRCATSEVPAFALKVQLIESPLPAQSGVDALSEGPEEPEQDVIPEAIARARRESAILAKCDIPQLAHPGPISLTELKIGTQRLLFSSEEWIDGHTLRSMISAKVQLSNVESLQLARDLTSAVEALDKMNILHRDIKPENIMHRKDGGWVLIDLGLALERGATSLSQPGAIPGTTPYFSPEQTDITRKHSIDSRSDMFAMGVVIYEAMSGIHPFANRFMTPVQIVTAIRNTEPRALDELRPDCALGVRTIVTRLLKKRPHARFGNPNVLAAAITKALAALEET